MGRSLKILLTNFWYSVAFAVSFGKFGLCSYKGRSIQGFVLGSLLEIATTTNNIVKIMKLWLIIGYKRKYAR